MTDNTHFRSFKGYPARGWDCGDVVAEWLTVRLYADAETRPDIRLMYVGDAEALKRPATKPDIFHFTQYKEGDVVRRVLQLT